MLTTRRATAGLNGHSHHTLVGGYSGEATARWSLDADGVAQYGDGGSSDKYARNASQQRQTTIGSAPQQHERASEQVY